MASKFTVSAAFEARLFLRPSHQRAVSFGTVNKLKSPIPGRRPTLPLILSSRSYSEAAATPPSPKSSESAESSRSSGSEEKGETSRMPWIKAQGKVVSGILVAVGVGLTTYAALAIWRDWYRPFRKPVHELALESAIYDKLKKGPKFEKKIEYRIPRERLVEEIRKPTTPSNEGGRAPYTLIIGEHGTGKTSVIELAVNGVNEPKGVIYVDMPTVCELEAQVVLAMQEALGWSPDDSIDAGERNTADLLLPEYYPEANVFEEMSLNDILKNFKHACKKFKREYKKVPVLIIDNSNRLSKQNTRTLDLFQDFAKDATDARCASVVFVTSEGRVLRHMRGRSSWSRSGRVFEIGDVTREEALQYLKLRNIDEKQAEQIYGLVGGRMIHLEFMADDIDKYHTFEAARNVMFDNAQEQLSSTEILPERSYHKEGAKIVRELLEKGSISRRAYYHLVGATVGDKFLESNVFAYHLNSGEITFQSTVMKRYCEENSALWEEMNVASM